MKKKANKNRDINPRDLTLARVAMMNMRSYHVTDLHGRSDALQDLRGHGDVRSELAGKSRGEG